MKKIDVLVLNRCIATPALGSFELFRMVNALHRQLTGKKRDCLFDVRLVACSPTSSVKTGDGLYIKCHAPMNRPRQADLILVPGFEGDVLTQLSQNREAIPWVRRQYARGADIASICTGAFVLAEAGLLDGKAATTHWAAQDLFSARYPRVEMKPQQIVVDEGRVITSGGAFSFLNLIIYLIEKYCGQDVALLASKSFLIDMNKSPQGAYAIFSGQKSHPDKEILKVQLEIERNSGQELPIARLAEKAAMSQRQLLRRFKQATGNTPIEYLQRVRIEAAKKALTETRSSLDEITGTVGYSDTPGFRKLFVRYTGLTPTEYRKKYNYAYASSYVG